MGTATAALMLLAILTVNSSQSYINESLTQRLDSLIQNKENEVTQAIDSWTESAAIISNNSQLSVVVNRYIKEKDPQDFVKIRSILNDILESSGVLVKLSILSSDRLPVASLGTLTNIERASVLRDVSEGHVFGLHQITKTKIGQTYIHMNEPIVFQGELLAELDVVIDVTGFIENFYDKTGLGDGGFSNVYARTSVGSWVDVANLKIKHNVDPNQEVEKIAYDGFFASFSDKRTPYITISRLVDGRPIILEININRAEVFTGIDDFYHQLLGAFVIVIIVTGLIALWFSRQITKPIEELNLTVGKVAEGERDVDIKQKPSHPLEIKNLTSNIEQMAKSLWKMNDNLEVVVQERTGQLKKLTENLELAVDERTREFQEANALLLDALEELHDTKSELVKAEKMAGLGELVAGVAHEINTPLGVAVTGVSSLEGQLQLLETNKNTGKLTAVSFDGYINESKKLISLMTDQLNVASSLIKNFKEVAVDQNNFDVRELNLNEYLCKVMDTVRPKFKPTQIKLLLNCDDKINFSTRPGAFSQVISNLLLNALLHAFDKGQAGLVTVNCVQQDSELKIDIIDDGNGIPAEHLTKIFDPFFTTKRGQGGSGLGLSIVFNIVTEALEGKINAVSEEGKGSTFTILIPQNLKNAEPSISMPE